MNYIAMCGCFRSGTTIAAELLSRHSEIVFTSEMLTYIDMHILNLKVEKVLAEFPHVGDGIFPSTVKLTTQDEYSAFLKNLKSKGKFQTGRQFVEFLLSQQRSKKPIKYYGDKLPEYLFHLERIKKLHSDVKVIFCVRDPRAVLESQIRNFFVKLQKGDDVRKHFWCKPTIEECINESRNWLEYMKAFEKNIRESDIKEAFVLNYSDLIRRKGEVALSLAKFLEVDAEEMKDIFTNGFKPTRADIWRYVFPELTNKLPKSWIEKMSQYRMEL